MADRRRRAGRISRVHKPAMIRSEARRLGARFRPRFRIRTWCRIQDRFGNNRSESTKSCKPDDDDDGLQKNNENLAHVQDGIKLNKLKNAGRLRNSPLTRSGAPWTTLFARNGTFVVSARLENFSIFLLCWTRQNQHL